MHTTERTIDGAIGEGWGGKDPDGCHVNVILAHRGGPTAAALMTAFTTPRQGHSPILVCVGPDKDHYENQYCQQPVGGFFHGSLSMHQSARIF